MLYKSPESFKQAVNDRLLKIARERQLPVHRFQSRFLMERLLVRVLHAFPQVIVKGGMAIDLRLKNARTTKDLDLGLRRLPANKILPELQRVCKMDFGDWLTFEFQEDRHHPVLLARLETHIAEKLHAYTLPRKTANSRVKDLPDMAILASARDLSSETLHSALDQTSFRRSTHPLPLAVPAPPP